MHRRLDPAVNREGLAVSSSSSAASTAARKSRAETTGAMVCEKYGGGNPDLYHRVKVFGADAVGDIFSDVEEPPKGDERAIIDQVYDGLGNAGSGRLKARAVDRPPLWREGAACRGLLRFAKFCERLKTPSHLPPAHAG